LLIPRLRIPFLWYCAAAFRYFIGSTRYKGLQFESDLTGGQYLKLDFVMWLYGLGLLILPVLLIVIPIAGLNLAGDGEIFQVFIQKANAHPGLYILTTAPITLAFLASIISYAILIVLFLTQRIIALHCHSITVTDDINFNVIRQSVLEAPTRGEGFADTLDCR
jgi:hypothetical protein